MCTALINYSEHALRNVCLLLTRIKRKVKGYYKYVLIARAKKCFKKLITQTNIIFYNYILLIEMSDKSRTRKGFDAAVWTALLPNFFEETKLNFSIHNALKYIESLPKYANKNALKYIQNASSEIVTPLRSKLIALKLIE